MSHSESVSGANLLPKSNAERIAVSAAVHGTV